MTEQSSAWRFINHIPSSIALFSAASIGFSILFDYGYFILIDTRAMTLMTLADHITMGILIIPVMVVNAGVLIGLFGFVLFKESPTEEWEPSRGSRILYVAVPFIVCAIGPVTIIADWLLRISDGQLTVAGIALTALPIAMFLVRHLTLRYKLAAFSGAGLAICSFMLGAVIAIDDLHNEKLALELSLTDGRKLDHVIILRHLERGLLTWDKQASRMMFFPWSQVAGYDRAIKVPLEGGVVCEVTGGLCDWP